MLTNRAPGMGPTAPDTRSDEVGPSTSAYERAHKEYARALHLYGIGQCTLEEVVRARRAWDENWFWPENYKWYL